MKDRSIFINRLSHFLIVFIILGYLMIIGKQVIIPLVFATLLTILLIPACRFLEKFLRSPILSILIALLLLVVAILAIISLFTVQFVDIVQALPSISKKLTQGLDSLFGLLEQYNLSPPSWSDWVKDNASTLIETPFSIFTSSLTASTALLANIILTLLYTFFLLLYRSSFKNFLLYQVGPERRKQAQNVIEDIQRLMQGYLRGLGTVIIILAILNSLGLWLIGIGYPVFWGILAACLVIIPYIGTTLGGTFPFLYALATASTWWQPAAVVVMYAGIQQLEGNIITPRIVGSSVKVNPMVSIIALFIFGLIWGIPGIILSIPIVAVVKVFMEQVDVLKPLSVLLGSEIYREKTIFKEEYDEDRYRLFDYFTRPPEKK